MFNFKQFQTYINEASIRQGLPHITSMDHNQFASLLEGGKVHLHDITEKTDGMTHVMGFDEGGFYTQSSGSGSEKMRQPGDYHARAKRRAEETGKPYSPVAPDAFAHVHSLLASNPNLIKHLQNQYIKTNQDTKIRGEVFYKPLGQEVNNEIKFVGTAYDPSHMGTVGKYVIHSKLPENHHVNLEHFKNNLSTPEMNFDDDVVQHEKKSVDVSAEARKFSGLNRELIASRTTPKNKEAKLAELDKMSKIQAKVSGKVDKAVEDMGISPKWGSGTEGIVVHPSASNSSAPRFKVTSAAFRDYKADPTNAEKFRNRNDKV
jgi:hypothetical protein